MKHGMTIDLQFLSKQKENANTMNTTEYHMTPYAICWVHRYSIIHNNNNNNNNNNNVFIRTE